MSEKSSSTSSSSSGGIGFAGLLTIVFITLKLLGKIDWPWWWVVSPLWISALLGVVILLIILGGAGVGLLTVYGLDKRDDRKRIQRAKERADQVASARAKPVEEIRRIG